MGTGLLWCDAANDNLIFQAFGLLGLSGAAVTPTGPAGTVCRAEGMYPAQTAWLL